MDEGIPALGVGFVIGVGDSFGELARLEAAMDSAEGRIIAEAARIEKATGGMIKLGGATAQLTTFGNAATKELQATARETARAEKAGEALSRQLDRQAAAFGKSREELRAMKVEAAALAAEQQGLTELAQRLRAQETALYDAEFAAMRRARAEADALAEDKAAAAAQSVAAADREAQAMREAAFAHQMFEAKVRAGAQAMREADQSAQRDAVTLARLRAMLDPAAAAQERLNEEISEARRVMQAAGASAEEMARAEQMLANGAGRIAAGATANRIAMQGASYQVQDFITQVSMGANPINAFAVQGAQLAGQFSNIEGKAGSVARFFMGPWGLAITAGLMMLGPFVGKLLEGNAALDDAAAKLKKDAQETEVTRLAKERFKTTAEGVAAAIRDGTEATKKAIEAQKTSAEQANIAAKANLAHEISVRRDTVAELERAKALAEQNANNALSGDAYDVVAKRLSDGRLARLQAELKVHDDLLKQAEARIGQTRIELAAEAAARAVDPMLRIKKEFDDQVNAAKGAASARVAAGQMVGAELTRELTLIERNRQAAMKAEQDRQSALKQTTNEIGRQITLLEARAIAEKAGGRVTSDLRSRDVQQGLYDKYMAYKNGTGPWAALAAKPGTSNHERGLALDIAKTDGMTLKKLVAAYRAAGVKLTEALDEGSHFHVAWAAGKVVTDAAKEAEKIVQMLRDQVTQAYGNAWQLAQEMQQRQQEWGKDDPGLEGLGINKADKDAEALKQAGIDNARAALDLYMADLDKVSERVDEVAGNMRRAFGSVGGAIGDVITTLDEYGKRQKEIDMERSLGGADAKRLGELRKQEIGNQLGGMIALTGAAKGLFKEHSKGYQAMAAAEKALTIIQLARTAVDVAGGAARMFATLGPFAFPAVAAMLGVMASLGFGSGGSAGSAPKTNTGTGTVLGDSDDKSDSIKRSIDSLKGIDTLMLGTSRAMLASLRSIDSQIGGFASLVLRAGNVDASSGVNTGFKPNAIGSVLSKIPVIGGLLGGLFGTKTKVVGSGLFGGPQSVGDILSGGFDASYYSDIQKKKKLFGITTSTKYSTQYSAADPGLENQFTLILREFDKAILAAAGPLGAATSDIQQRLNSFVVNIGKIDLKDLTGEQIQEKLNAVFGAAADNMANAAFPGMEKFQKVGEGLFETLVRVASTVETVTSSLSLLGTASTGLTTDLKMSLADQFESVSALSEAVSGYFSAYYTQEEQAAARTAQMGKVFESLGLTMPSTLAGFRALVEAQSLTTAAGQATYATLLQLAPAFADLQAAMNGAKSAADIIAERQDLQRKLLELNGDTAAIRALDLANLDASNRALQQQIWSLQDAQEAAKAADALRDAWKSVGDTIMDEVKRIRGLTGVSENGGFASLMGQFNAASTAARGGDQNAAKSLPGISQALLKAAADAATSRQELDRVQAQTAASLEATFAAIQNFAGASATTQAAQMAAAATAQTATAPDAANDDMLTEIRALREELAGMRADNNSGHAATAGNTGAVRKTLENVTAAAGGEAITVANVAA